MSRKILIVTAVQAEADAIGKPGGTFVVAGGIGRTNAATTTTSVMLSEGPFTWVLNAGVAGSLTGGDLSLGDIVVANKCVYTEEGLMTPSGFQNMQQMGFSLGNFVGNEVPVDPWLLERLSTLGRVAPIATVATCSGTDEQAELVATRTGAICEAMEGAAVVHAANRFNTPGIELRTISNTTGNRDAQEWNLEFALQTLGKVVNESISALWS